MKILVVAGGHYYKNTKGEVYVQSLFDYTFYSRYLEVFEEVYAIVRMQLTEDIPKNAKIASGKNLHFWPIPETRGAWEYFVNRKQTVALVKEYVKQSDLAIFRLSESTAHLVHKYYAKTKKKYAVEVIVDPWEFFSPGTVTSITRPFVRCVWTYELKRACKHANGVSYVTKAYLQNKYPCRALRGNRYCFTAYYSSVDIPDNSFRKVRSYKMKDTYVISHVANAFTGYGKGHRETMQVVKKLIKKGLNIKVCFVGNGPLMGAFKKYASDLDISEYCVFLGLLPDSTHVREVIKNLI